MFDSNNLVHPFQNDGGCSQSQRIMDALLANAPKIDARSQADLLNYFVQLAPRIKFSSAVLKDKTWALEDSDWRGFFSESVPFSLAAAIANDGRTVGEKLDLYAFLCTKSPSPAGIRLLINYFYYSTVYYINKLYADVSACDLPITGVLQQQIANQLKLPVTNFIRIAYTAHNLFGIASIDFSSLFNSDPWKIDPAGLLDGDADINAITGSRDQLLAIAAAIKALFPPMLATMKTVSVSSGDCLQPSLTGLKDDLKQRHAPHLALLFTFLNIFGKLQNDLNGFTKKHLDFFYQQVLQLQPRAADPDSIFLVFELQKQLPEYLLPKGLLLKAGDKDKNKAEIDFALDSDLVVNETTIADLRTLHINNAEAGELHYVEGEYAALKVGENPPFPTLGAKYPTTPVPGEPLPDPYPSARIGFVLTSPVLLLNEGTRNIDISLACQIISQLPAVNKKEYPGFLDAAGLLSAVQSLIGGTYVYLSTKLVQQAIDKGLKADTAKTISDALLKDADDIVVTQTEWNAAIQGLTSDEQAFLAIRFPLFRPLKIQFSGDKDWIQPDSVSIDISAGTGGAFTLHISATINAGQDPVTGYNMTNLKEDLGTTDPLVKIELIDTRKISFDQLGSSLPIPADPCILRKIQDLSGKYISLYHFFRDTVLNGSTIVVNVCGLNNFVVQNDDSVQDITGPVYPFGTRPEIIDFDDVMSFDMAGKKFEPGDKNLVGPNFYVGSPELFSKRWDKVCVKMNWKNKPVNFNEHYKGYLKRLNYHDCKNPAQNDQEIYGLNECDFQVNLALLDNGQWVKEPQASGKGSVNPITTDYNRPLFAHEPCDVCTDTGNTWAYSFFIESKDFGVPGKFDTLAPFKKYEPGLKKGFFRFTLENQDFLHKDYAFVLSRQMMALGRFPDTILEGAVYAGSGDTVVVYKDIGNTIIQLKSAIEQTNTAATTLKGIAAQLQNDYINAQGGDPATQSISDGDRDTMKPEVDENKRMSGVVAEDANEALGKIRVLEDLYPIFQDGKPVKDLSVIIPSEPWTPIISNMSIDYKATATGTDIKLIHLYPYLNTYKEQEISLAPTLLPTFYDEGTLFIGLDSLVPGSTVNVLFQLAEATSNSESDIQVVYWSYLAGNQWLPLRKGFELVDDGTDNLTASGILQFAFPEGMTDNNTVMPSGLYWIKASVPRNSSAVCETIGVFTQAAKASFVISPDNDSSRLSQPLGAGAVSKLVTADASVKTITQPAASFDGREPEANLHYYLRVSELLRHKNRTIQKFDYERVVLEAFPQVFKAKCINHSFHLDAGKYDNDFPIAPGYVMIAVIPDLTRLLAEESFQPMLPTGIIEKIESFLSARSSPFIKTKVVNPRYEKVNFNISVILNKGFDAVYYKDRLSKDLREFLAPWAVGVFDKLRFGQAVNKSDVVEFIETREYVDYITSLTMQGEFDRNPPSENTIEVSPRTPRSILLAGNIDITIGDGASQQWENAPICQGNMPFANFPAQPTTIPL